MEAVIKQLSRPSRRQLRLACKALLAHVDACATRAVFSLAAPYPAGLQPKRFPRMQELQFRLLATGSCHEHHMHERAVLKLGLAARLLPDPWLSVTLLQLDGLSEADTRAVVSRCPNVTQLQLGSVTVPGSKSPVRLPHTISHICSNLPSLTDFLGSSGPVLGDRELCLLSGMASVRTVQLSLDREVSNVGWAALGSMTQLRHLSISSTARVRKCPDALDLQPLQMLTRLAFKSWGSASLCQRLRLPTGLVELVLVGMPKPALPLLPLLTRLELSQETTADATLARLAVSCPALISMRILRLAVSEACHTTPLCALTQLNVLVSCIVGQGVRLAVAFPSLQDARMDCAWPFSAGVGLFSGTTALRLLDIGWPRQDKNDDDDNKYYYGDDDGEPTLGLSMEAGWSDALARLPHLDALRMNAEAQHIRGLSALTQLRRLCLVFVANGAMLCQLDDAFSECPAPATSLQHAYLEFMIVDTDDEVDDDDEGEEEVERVADAAAAWLAHAPALCEVTWDASMMYRDGSYSMALNTARLHSIAGNPGVKHIEYAPNSIIPAAQQRVLRMHSDRPLSLVHVECQYDKDIGHPFFL